MSAIASDNGRALTGGTVTAVSRVGDTVRRATGPWTPAVHALLRHLERVGFDGAPHVLGIDRQGREILTYLDGETGGVPLAASMRSDEALVEVARLLGRYHRAVADFTPPANARWRYRVGIPQAGEVICHGDIAPYNTVFASGRPVAFIDWDFAVPGPPLWDVCYALWRFVPLYADENCEALGWPPPSTRRGPRIRLFCDAYGLDPHERAGLLDLVSDIQHSVYESVKRWAAAGTQPYATWWARDKFVGPERDRRWLAEHRFELLPFLDAGRSRADP